MLPALVTNSFIFAGMSKTTQCHHPLPVGASGSYIVIAKLLVPSGAFSQESCGDLFSPSHPKPLNSSVFVA